MAAVELKRAAAAKGERPSGGILKHLVAHPGIYPADDPPVHQGSYLCESGTGFLRARRHPFKIYRHEFEYGSSGRRKAGAPQERGEL